jgi:hypothetical protein
MQVPGILPTAAERGCFWPCPLEDHRTVHKAFHMKKQFAPIEQKWIDKLNDWCKQVQESIGEEQKRIHIIQMSAISPELCSRTGFNLAVPGTYRGGTPPNRMKHFVGQFSVCMLKQQPKNVVVRGYDVTFYQ